MAEQAKSMHHAVMQVYEAGPGDEELVRRAADLFDDPVDEAATRQFLADDRHHLLLAKIDGRPVGFVTAVELLHPDKPHPEMFIYELGVAAEHRRRGVATALLQALITLARERGCREMFVLTEPDNLPAIRTYAAAGGIRAAQALFYWELAD